MEKEAVSDTNAPRHAKVCRSPGAFATTWTNSLPEVENIECDEDSRETIRVSRSEQPTTVKTSQRTKTFQAFMDSLKTSPRKVTKLSIDYATRR